MPKPVATSYAWVNPASARSRSPSSNQDIASECSIVARNGLAGLSPSRARALSARIAAGPSRQRLARMYASVAATVVPSDNVPLTGRLSATPTQRSASRGLPSRAKINAPCAAIAA